MPAKAKGSNFRMAENCTHNCETCSANCSSREGGQTAPQFAALNQLSRVGKVIAVASGKGGVGKSLVTSLLAVTLRRRGYNVAVLDADITGPSIPKAFGITGRAEGQEGMIFPARSKTGIDIMSINLLLENSSDPVVWRGPILGGVVQQFWTDVVWNDIDFMLIDMPPGTGDVPLTIYQSLPVNGLITVTSPQSLVSMVVGKAVKMAGMLNIPMLGVVENMSYVECPDCGKQFSIFGDSHVEEIVREFNLPLLGQLPINPKLAAACDAGAIELFEGDWLEPAADAICALGDKPGIAEE